MKKKLLSLTLALALCLGLALPAFAKDVTEATKSDFMDTFTIYRNGSVDEKKGDYSADTPVKFIDGLELDEDENAPIHETNYSVVSKDDSWTITNAGSKELTASGSADYELFIMFFIWHPYPEVDSDVYLVPTHGFYWAAEGYGFPDIAADAGTTLTLKAGESTTIPFSALWDAGTVDDALAGTTEYPDGCIFEMRIFTDYQGVYDSDLLIEEQYWQYYTAVEYCSSFYFWVDEEQKAKIDSTLTAEPTEPEDPTEPTTPAGTFSDVSEGDWYYTEVQWAADKGYIKGNPDGTFGPNGLMSRGAIFTILARVDNVDADGGSTWYQKGMDWAVEKGVSDGSNPEGDIPMDQLIVMLYRYTDKPDADLSVLDQFSDASDISPWDDFREAMAWAVETGILQGTPDGTLDPLSNLARGRGAVILQRYCENILGK